MFRILTKALLAACIIAGSPAARASSDAGAVVVRVEEGVVIEELIPAGVRAVRLPGRWPVYRVEVPGRDAAAIADRLADSPSVAWAAVDAVLPIEAHALPVDDLYAAEQWHLENTGQRDGLPGADIGIGAAWAITTGEGQIVAVMDSGVDLAHPDLDLVPGHDAIDQDDDPSPNIGSDGDGHGTNVAGVVAARGDNGIGVVGVAYRARVLPVRMIGGNVTASQMYAAYALAVDGGADVINNSWGYVTDPPCAPIDPHPALSEAMEYARLEGRDGRGTVVVFSAGNGGCEANENGLLEGNPGIITVGAVTQFDRKFGYSVWGDPLDVMAPSGPGGDGPPAGLWTTDLLGAPGWNGAPGDDDYTPRFGGTSGAAPVVSGTVALMFAANSRLLESDVRWALCDTAVRVDPEEAAYNSAGWSRTYGCGRIDAGAAVSAVANTGPPEAPLWLSGTTLLPGEALRFTAPADPDGDLLAYSVQIAAAEDEDDDSATALLLDARVDRPTFALDLPPGRYRATVTASDLWGPGAPSEALEFAIVAPAPRPPDGDGNACEGGGAAMIAALAGLRRLRRRPTVLPGLASPSVP